MNSHAPPGSFTSHNIVLPDGTQTAPGFPVVAESGACRAALRDLAMAFPSGQAEAGAWPKVTASGDPITVADLGCLEGGYAAEFARAGYDVTGFEVRDDNYALCLQVQAALGLPNLRFIQGDVRDLLPGRQFDAVFCCGLLYHLDRPVEFLNLLGKVTRRVLVLNTHYSLQAGHPEGIHQPGEQCHPGGERNEGRSGHWFDEVGGRWSSHGNMRSFWLARDDLMAAIAEAGFADVSEQLDWRNGDASLPWGSGGAFDDRGMFVALKP